jgi:hypothetical protein
MIAQPTEQAAADAISRCVFNIEGYGRIVQIRGAEQHGPHSLPLAVFAGGKSVALYQVKDSEGRWLRVYR